tara:strand:- start:987 stop:1175 length:189 start_codon:yes stop_codon:yes gene_type:complete
MDRNIKTLSISLKHAEMHMDTLLNPPKSKDVEITENDIRHIAGHIKYVREKLMDSDGITLRE